MDINYFLCNLWLWKCDIEEKEIKIIPSYELLKETEWSKEFEILMRNRLILGAIRYNTLKDTKRTKRNYVDNAIKRLNQYNKTGNLELIVDVANICLVEFVVGNHPNKHFKSFDNVNNII